MECQELQSSRGQTSLFMNFGWKSPCGGILNILQSA